VFDIAAMRRLRWAQSQLGGALEEIRKFGP
jgi:hypothetical protein